MQQLQQSVLLIMSQPSASPRSHSSDGAAVVLQQHSQNEADTAAAAAVQAAGQEIQASSILQQQQSKIGSPGGAAGSSSHPGAYNSSSSHGRTGKAAESVAFTISKKYAVTAEHCVSHVEIGGTVTGELPRSAGSQGKRRLLLKVVYKDEVSDIAVLELQDGEHPKWLQLYTGSVSELPGAILALATYNIALLQELPEFNTGLGIWHAAGVRLGRQQQHLLFSCSAWAGDSGSPLVTPDGLVVGVHVKGINQLVDQFNHLPVAATGPLRVDMLNKSVEAAHNSIEELQAAAAKVAASPASGCLATLLTALPQEWLDRAG